MSIFVDSDYEGGSIQALDAAGADGIVLALRPDNAADIRQAFAFRVHGRPGTALHLRIVGLAGSSYPRGWEGYRVCLRQEGGAWTRTDTRFAGDEIEFGAVLAGKWVEFAYFPTYDRRALTALLDASAARGASVTRIGRSARGVDIPMLTIGRPGPSARRVWLLARQHPAETQGAYWMEGAVEALLGDGPAAEAARQGRAVFHLVPDTNPDGGMLGNLRTNALGHNLNRFWDEPTAETPEVACIRDAMRAEGVDAMLDVHADEVLPYVFSVGADTCSFWTPRLRALREGFERVLLARNPHFQTERGYALDRPGHDSTQKCTPWVAREFDCLALTLEMPFKDDANRPDPADGWSIARSRRFGADCVLALAAGLDSLRG